MIELKLELDPKHGVSPLEVLEIVKLRLEEMLENHIHGSQNPEMAMIQGFSMSIPDADNTITWQGEKVIHAAGTFEAKP